MERLSRKEREKLARRKVILAEARRIFAQKGLHETTLDEIAERCELAKGTLYGYFESKEDLFFSVLEEAIGNVERVLTKAAGSGHPPPEKISEMAKTMMVLFDENMDLMQLMTRNQPGVIMSKMRERMMSQFRNLLGLVSRVIKEGIKQGLFRPTDTDRAAAAFFNLIHGNAMNSFWQNKRICNPKDLEFVISFLFNGLSGNKNIGGLNR